MLIMWDTMAQIIRGIKAGGFAGIVFGLTYMIVAGITSLAYYDIYSKYFTMIIPEITRSSVIALALSAIIAGLIAGIVVGIIFGVIYAISYDYLPGTTSMKKGVQLAVVLWLIFDIFIEYFIFSSSMEFYILNNIVIGFFSSIIWGIAVGTFWDKQEKIALIDIDQHIKKNE